MDAEDGIKVVEKRRYHLRNSDGTALAEGKEKKTQDIGEGVFRVCHLSCMAAKGEWRETWKGSGAGEAAE